MSFLNRLFGGAPSVSPEDRGAALAYLIRLNALRAIQDDTARQYNGVMAKGGVWTDPAGENVREVAAAAEHQSKVYANLVVRHRESGPIPDVAGKCYFAWCQAWILLDQWASLSAASTQGMLQGATPPVSRIQQLLVGEANARGAAGKEEGKLLKALRVTAEEARQLIEEGERMAKADGAL